MKIRDKPLLYYVINQTLHSQKIDKIVVATTNLQQDDQIVQAANQYGVDTYRGSEEDVLDRYYQCAIKYNPNIIVRLTSDNPLNDPHLIDKCMSEFEKNHFDYISNTNKQENKHNVFYQCGYPLGFAVEVFTFTALKKSWGNAKKPSEREHVTQYILNNPQFFKIGNIENITDNSDIRLSVDHQVDFDLVKIVIEHFEQNEIFTLEKIISFFNKNPKLKQMNSHLDFREGYLKSLEKDKSSSKNPTSNSHIYL